MQALILANYHQVEGGKIQMLECAWSVSRHTHSMEWSACSSIHSTPRNGVCHTPKMHSEWNGMECRSRSITVHSAQDCPEVRSIWSLAVIEVQWIVRKVPCRKQKGNLSLSLYQAAVYLECPLFLRKGAVCVRESGGLFSWISADCPFVSFFILPWLAGNCPFLTNNCR